MCLAIYKPAGKTIKRRYLENGFQANSDGAGFAYVQEGRVIIEKGFFTFDDFWKAWEPHQEQAAVVHFRLATHGAKDQHNCHPFEMASGLYAVVHNGILNIQSTKEASDTWHFVNLVLGPSVEKMGLDCPVLHYLAEQAIGTSNKIVVLKPTGEAVILNERQGIWDKGVWYSNSGYIDGGWYRFGREGSFSCGATNPARTKDQDQDRGTSHAQPRRIHEASDEDWSEEWLEDEHDTTDYYLMQGYTKKDAEALARLDRQEGVSPEELWGQV